MSNQKTLINFTNKYQLTKTLRFELIPQGKTQEHIDKRNLISKDQDRAVKYEKMKKSIDAFHKDFTELAMSKVKLTKLQEFKNLYQASSELKKEDSYKKELKEIQSALRKEIVKGFSEGEAKEIFSKLDKKELITKLLEPWIREEEKDLPFYEDFKSFTTYFTGFHENRKNMYTDKEQPTAIAYRLIHENLPKFIDNLEIFKSIKKIPELYSKCPELYKDIEEYLNINTIDEAFTLDYYNQVLTQKQIDTYNLIIGGRSKKEATKKIQGLNEYINLYNQKQNKKNKIPKFKQLYKQILSDRESISFLPEKFEDDGEKSASQKVLDTIEDYYKSNLIDFKPKDEEETVNILKEIYNLLKNLKNYNLSKVYLKNNTHLSGISQKIFGSYSVFSEALHYYYETEIDPLFQSNYKKVSSSKREKLDKDKNKFIKQDYISIELLEEALDKYINSLDETHEVKVKYIPHCLVDYFHTYFIAEKEKDSDKSFDLISNIEAKYSCIKGVLNIPYPEDKKLHQEKNEITNIKAFLDSLMEILHFVKPLFLTPDSNISEKDEKFYEQFNPLYHQLQLLIPLYNKVRDYSTQKPYSSEKIKLNFENAQLLSGWDANKERDYLTTLFQKEGNFYLGIMDKKNNKVLSNIPEYQDGKYFEKMNYKLLPGVNKMLPKVFFSKKNIDFFNPSEELLNNYKNDTHKKGDNFSLSDCHNLIDFFKESLSKHEDWKHFNFKFSPTSTYSDLSDFYKEVSEQGYKITFEKVSEDYINQLVDEGKLYLFQIYNKDFSPYSKGRPNLHTMYWKSLFSPENLKNIVYKLNGQAEMFYRKKSIRDNIVIHEANKPIDNKNPKTKDKTSIFEYDIIKDKRYTVDKFQFHVPITMNFKASGLNNINGNVLDFLKNNPNVNIIGLDRGERHLIYLTLINLKGELLLQKTFNTIKSEKYNLETNYHQLLQSREDERDKARKSWSTIENIKDLKQGYLSIVVHEIAQLMVEHNAIVVMEDLNFGFKRGRFKIEKQVYQKLEKMLIDKLNYLVFKDKKDDELGGIYQAYQLTNKFESFQKLGKQSGFLFYVPAWNTSKIDPTTGFVNLFYLKYENLEKAKEFFNQFKKIEYNSTKDYFEFEFDYNDFTTRAEGTQTKWTVCTYGERIKNFRNPDKNNQWDDKIIHLTDSFKTLFNKYQIDYQKNLQSQIIEQNEASFFKELIYLFKLTLQMRNSKTNSDVDYLISPVINSQGKFFDSINSISGEPENADANGAYHIAKKGLWALEQINSHEGDSWKKLKLAISNKDWLNYVQSNV